MSEIRYDFESFRKMCTFSELRNTTEKTIGVINRIWNHIPKFLYPLYLINLEFTL
jgi:hypothetical protein